MHYRINDDCLIKSENAALTTKQYNKQIVNYINTLPENIVTLDYGCGKLRHSLFLYPKCSLLVLVDSEIQLNRIQVINNQNMSVTSFIEEYMPNSVAIPLNDNTWKTRKYDFILCSNVLSAIPSQEERMNVLTNIRDTLTPDGKALISVQYYNSYFSSYIDNPKAKPFLDGWIIERIGNYTFYGIIKPESLIEQCITTGLRILGKKQVDGTVYLEVAINN